MYKTILSVQERPPTLHHSLNEPQQTRAPAVGSREVLHRSLNEPRMRTRYNPNITENRLEKSQRNFNLSDRLAQERSEHLDDISEPNLDESFATHSTSKSHYRW
jgi:hypothetical protein